jgi:[ribosomal protein S5]-alanine N-acetyltransferase
MIHKEEAMSLPSIKTDRLLLREIHIGDAKDMYEYARRPNVGPMAGWEPHESLADSINVIDMFHRQKEKGALGVWAIVWRETEKMIGTIELHGYRPGHKAELGYVISSEYWGKGITVEASKAVLKYAFEFLHLKRVDCNAFTVNQQSIRVCEKLGLHLIGTKKKAYMRYDGQIFDEVMFGITDDEYFSS